MKAENEEVEPYKHYNNCECTNYSNKMVENWTL